MKPAPYRIVPLTGKPQANLTLLDLSALLACQTLSHAKKPPFPRQTQNRHI
jgi:hypothetical protein